MLSRKKTMRNLGLAALAVMMSMSAGCSTPQTVKTVPDYSAEFFRCMADESRAERFVCNDPGMNSDGGFDTVEKYQDACQWEKGVLGPCSREALKDWQVMVGI